MELRLAIARFVAVVNRNGRILMLAAQPARRARAPAGEWEPYVSRFVAGAEARIERDQERGIAPDDISARIAAQALCAMVERHLTSRCCAAGATSTRRSACSPSCGCARSTARRRRRPRRVGRRERRPLIERGRDVPAGTNADRREGNS